MSEPYHFSFHHPYDYTVYLANKNYEWEHYSTAITLYKKAVRLARNEEERTFCRNRVLALEKFHKSTL